MEKLAPYRTQGHFYSNREQRALSFYNQVYNINTSTESTQFARNRPKQYQWHYRKEDDMKRAAARYGSQTAASFPEIKKDPYYSGHNTILTEQLPYSYQ